MGSELGASARNDARPWACNYALRFSKASRVNANAGRVAAQRYRENTVCLRTRHGVVFATTR